MLSLIVSLNTALFADEYSYSDSWGEAGYSITEQNNSKVIVNYSITNFHLYTSDFEGEDLHVIDLPGNFLFNDEGAPNLPGGGRYIAFPHGAKVSYNVISYRTETLSGIKMSPAPRIPLDTEAGPLDYSQNEEIYSKNRYYPEQPIKLSKPEVIRGVDAVILGITPFHYNPVTQVLVVYRDIKIEMSFDGGSGNFGEDRLRSRWWDPLLSDMLLNYESLPEIDYNKSFQNTEEDGCEYLIVSPDGAEFQQWADSIKKFRTLQGIFTKVVTISDIGG
ncbi:MAG: hypothetical protein K8R53_00915, partial [Bacteroidales bacterium]|nr:hypothetical protein [Bacteroidales bacterium]